MSNFMKTRKFIEFCHGAFDNLPILVDFLDADGKIIYMNKVFADFLRIPLEDIIGRIVTDVNPTSKFMETLKAQKADIAMRHTFPSAGKEAIVHRIPIFGNDGELLGGFGMVVFEQVDQIIGIIKQYENLDRELRMYKNELAKINTAKYSIQDILGDSPAIARCKKQLQKCSGISLNVLIFGESGVGKELVAHALHNLSSRHDQPFVGINCSAIPEHLLESELFGYEEGSFTGAKRGGNIGKFELADGGTIFLDEIGDMPYYMQAKLLRVLQEKEITKIGGKNPTAIDVRVICATHKDLPLMIKNGEFRDDLYYRLNVLTIEVPPLRERSEDISQLVRVFLDSFWKESGLFRKMSKPAMDVLRKYDWPGNIRELKNVVHKMAVNADDTEITINDLPKNILNASFESDFRFANMGLNDVLRSIEKRMIRAALDEAKLNKSLAAAKLDIPRVTLYRKMKEYKLE
ncbi:RNA polymerase sigma factor 54 interaction domain protein [Acididesulfobacillus acetoxydans]|uniref:RNA polymerase sigma factor 54 interaction domain protein n=1 Tax=Acididesulfobacillus acetoxydans TaxID=1561005 RepID=A0A8S0X6T4_9FIRM|nr:sigma 54-interacting transcriptional regulator [Acididesulfobacillus acetoxydans]CAA7602800.1 RNA polymerase sigma factor 54 interaction domain protein [Acididesulfobacillus acetoxydans]CEJ06343.1 Signal-transduction and transcriptional-control protein [Acididesulfobacillus acetoxydans]